MKSAKVSVVKKKIGRPPTGVGLLIGLRWHEPALAEIDAWAAKAGDGVTRSEAIRRLVELGLRAKSKAR